jgi:hypothetical protein
MDCAGFVPWQVKFLLRAEWYRGFVKSLAATVSEGEQGESRRRGDGMHSTEPFSPVRCGA